MALHRRVACKLKAVSTPILVFLRILARPWPLSGKIRSQCASSVWAVSITVLPLAGTTWRKICNGWSTMHGLWGEPHCGGCIVVINSVKPFLLDKDYSADARASDTAQNQQRTYFQLEHPTEARKLRRSISTRWLSCTSQ